MRLSPAFAPLLAAVVLLPYACGGGKASRDASAGGDGSISISGTGGSAGGAGGSVGGGTAGAAAGSTGNAGAGNRAGTAGGGMSGTGGTSGTGNTAGSRACGGTTGPGGAGGGCECPRGYIACGGLCVLSNDSHCGDCTTTCSGSKGCSEGRCLTKCPVGTECAADEVCALQFCEPRCPFGDMACPDGACVNVNGGDPFHCGDCTTVCPSGTSCNAGRCS